MLKEKYDVSPEKKNEESVKEAEINLISFNNADSKCLYKS